MRQFTLENSTGRAFSLNDETHFLHSPSGLGFSRDIEFQRVGNAYETLRDSFNQTVISASICFADNNESSAYEKYCIFTQFLQDTPLTLIYTSNKPYKMDVIPTSIDKTEMSAMGLDVSLELTGLSHFYDEAYAKGTGEVIIKSDSNIISPCSLRIAHSESTSSWSWSQTVDGVEVMTGSNTANAKTIEIHTDRNPYQILKVADDESVTDIYGNSNFATKRFPFIYPGVNKFICTGRTLTVRGRILYATV